MEVRAARSPLSATRDRVFVSVVGSPFCHRTCGTSVPTRGLGPLAFRGLHQTSGPVLERNVTVGRLLIPVDPPAQIPPIDAMRHFWRSRDYEFEHKLEPGCIFGGISRPS